MNIFHYYPQKYMHSDAITNGSSVVHKETSPHKDVEVASL